MLVSSFRWMKYNKKGKKWSCLPIDLFHRASSRNCISILSHDKIALHTRPVRLRISETPSDFIVENDSHFTCRTTMVFTIAMDLSWSCYTWNCHAIAKIIYDPNTTSLPRKIVATEKRIITLNVSQLIVSLLTNFSSNSFQAKRTKARQRCLRRNCTFVRAVDNSCRR